jgi:integrase
VTSKLLTHRSVQTTADVYVHLDAEDVRAKLAAQGVWQPEGSR